MGPHPNDQQQKGFQTTGQAAIAKIQEKFLKGKPTRKELYESIARLEALIGFIYQYFPELRKALDERLKQEAQPVQAQAQTLSAETSQGDELLVNTSTEPIDGQD